MTFILFSLSLESSQIVSSLFSTLAISFAMLGPMLAKYSFHVLAIVWGSDSGPFGVFKLGLLQLFLIFRWYDISYVFSNSFRIFSV